MKRATVPDTLLSPKALDMLRAHDWSGNVRELANAIEHAVILSYGQTIEPEHLPSSITRRSSSSDKPFMVTNFSHPLTLREIEMEVILQTLDKFNGDKPLTADELGIALKTLYNKLNQYQAHDHADAA